MTDDPIDGLDPKDVAELERLFNEILKQSGTHRELFVTDDVGITDEVIHVVVTPGTVGARADVPTPRVLTVEGRVDIQSSINGDAIALPAGVDRQTFKRMLDLAGTLAAALTIDYIGNAIYEKTSDQFFEALRFVASVLANLRPYL